MRNYYVERDNGNIVGLFARPQYGGQEFLPETDPTIIAFLNPVPTEAELEAKANELKIDKEIRQLAIVSLKDKGELPVDYKGD